MEKQHAKWSEKERREGRQEALPQTWVRTAVALLWHRWDRPPTDYWGGTGGFIAYVTCVLHLKPGARNMIKKVLHKAKKAHAVGSLFEPARDGGGRPAYKLDLGGGDVAVITRALEDGLGRCLITEIINIRRKARGDKTVSVASVVRAGRRAGGVAKRRESCKSGSADVDSKWAKARVAQCEMVLRVAGIINGPLRKDADVPLRQRGRAQVQVRHAGRPRVDDGARVVDAAGAPHRARLQPLARSLQDDLGGGGRYCGVAEPAPRAPGRQGGRRA